MTRPPPRLEAPDIRTIGCSSTGACAPSAVARLRALRTSAFLKLDGGAAKRGGRTAGRSLRRGRVSSRYRAEKLVEIALTEPRLLPHSTAWQLGSAVPGCRRHAVLYEGLVIDDPVSRHLAVENWQRRPSGSTWSRTTSAIGCHRFSSAPAFSRAAERALVLGSAIPCHIGLPVTLQNFFPEGSDPSVCASAQLEAARFNVAVWTPTNYSAITMK